MLKAASLWVEPRWPGGVGCLLPVGWLPRQTQSGTRVAGRTWGQNAAAYVRCPLGVCVEARKCQHRIQSERFIG